ncbi:MAG: alanine racemase [Bacteroidales bacterium]|nr:alanine racemase [Candidatus Physcousia equi]
MYSIPTITTLIGAHQIGEAEVNVKWLLTDSRSLCFPEESLFFAIKTQRGDGHRYIPSLYQQGVRAFVVSERPASLFTDAVYLLVPDTLSALQRLAERHRECHEVPVIGITGSNGKTTIKEWLYQMLSPEHFVTRSPRSYNSQIGVPLSVWNLEEQTDLAIFEAGISQPGEMEALEQIIQPTLGIFTHLGEAHQENFSSLEQKCEEKMLLFRHARVLFYPQRDVYVANCAKRLLPNCQLIPFDDHLNEASDAIACNQAICVAVCRHLGMDEPTIKERLAHLQPVAMRLEVKEGRHGCTLINDSYNSDLGSLDIALDFMSRRPDGVGRNHVLILSDIEQSGLSAAELAQRVATRVAGRGISRFVGVGPQFCSQSDMLSRACSEAFFFETTEAFLASPVFSSLHDEVVLIKGARSFHFENIVEQLELKVHETILEVNLNAVVDNLNYYRSFLHPETKMVCMIKASGYGAGSVELARTLQDSRVDYMAVAVADEGVELRRAGITAGIIIMNPEMTSFRNLFRHRLEPEVYSFRLLDALISEAEREGITNFPIHIKLDTGMHRLGFDPMHDMPQLIERLKRQKALIPRSVFSHFVGSDADNFDAFSAIQYERYLHGADLLQEAFSHHILRHMCNSAGIEHFPERQMDMVRLGLGLYGINPRNNQLIHNVSTLRTTILQIHDVPKEETVGYSRKGKLLRDSRIAALPIGYADGLDRLLGNGNGWCVVNGQRAPYVGNICMDVCMIDVTDIPCKEGDQAVVFGDELPVSQLSDIIHTIPYELLTGVSPRVKRVYYKE